MRLVAWLSGRRKIHPEYDTPAAQVAVIEPVHRSFILENLVEDEENMCMHIDVFCASAAQFSDWVHVEDAS